MLSAQQRMRGYSSNDDGEASTSSNNESPNFRLKTSQERPRGAGTAATSHFYQLSLEKEQSLRSLYKQLDHNRDGRVDIKDLTSALKRHMPQLADGTRTSYAKRIMQQARQSGSDSSVSDIDFADFVHYVLEHEKKLAIMFTDLDLNKDGVVDVKELQNYFKGLGLDISNKEAFDLLQKMDKDKDRTIDLDEFKNYLILSPIDEPQDILSFWRHEMVYDIGEDIAVPEDFSSRELLSGVWWRHLVAGSVAGAMSRTCTAPFDRLKVFLQVHASRSNNLGLLSGMNFLVTEGGVSSLWRGNFVNVLKIAPESGIKFMAYEQIKRVIKGQKTRELGIMERFCAGSLAGSIAQTAIYPMEVLKTRLALRSSSELNCGIWNAAVTIYRHEGWKVFYRGYLPNILGIIPYAGIDLAVYETLKSLHQKHFHKEEPGVLVLLLCGTTSSTCGQLSSYPLALVRTKLQAMGLKKSDEQSPTMTGLFKTILRNEGFFGLYRGLMPNFIKVLPSVSISYIVYETVRKQLGVRMT